MTSATQWPTARAAGSHAPTSLRSVNETGKLTVSQERTPDETIAIHRGRSPDCLGSGSRAGLGRNNHQLPGMAPGGQHPSLHRGHNEPLSDGSRGKKTAGDGEHARRHSRRRVLRRAVTRAARARPLRLRDGHPDAVRWGRCPLVSLPIVSETMASFHTRDTRSGRGGSPPAPDRRSRRLAPARPGGPRPGRA